MRKYFALAGIFLAFVLTSLPRPAEAFVESIFSGAWPDARATIVLKVYCVVTCPTLPAGMTWEDAVRDAAEQWNAAGSNFVFDFRSPRPDDDPCVPQKGTVMISFTSRESCGYNRYDRAAATEISTQKSWARVFLIADWEEWDIYDGPFTGRSDFRRLVLHELGHVVGLDHPDEHGQNVEAVMNSVVSHPRLQPDDIDGIRYLFGTRDISKGILENPGKDTTLSGVGVISGWKCEVDGELSIRFNGDEPIPLVYGSERPDTASVCGDTDNGFVAIWNWGNLGDGEYTAVVYDDGLEFDRSTFTVVTTGVEFLRGVTGSGTVTLSNGQQATVEWLEGLQGFVATAFTPLPGSGGEICTTKTATVHDINGAPAEWTITNPCEASPGGQWRLPTDITALSSEGFYAWKDYIEFTQGGVSFSEPAGNIWVDWADGEPGPFLPPLISFRQPRELTLVVNMNPSYGGEALNLSEPFQIYYYSTLIFEFP